MDSKIISPINSVFVCFLFFNFFVSSADHPLNNANSTSFEPGAELKKLKHIRGYLKNVNKPAVKTIQSRDGDLIDCVSSHQQPAFDHPLLKGHRPKVLSNWPVTSHNNTFEESFQPWAKSGESCPENTVPIRRITEEDVVRASSVQTFGRKQRPVRTMTTVQSDDDQEDIQLYYDAAKYTVPGDYYMANARVQVWAPTVEFPLQECSSSQIWLKASPTPDNQKYLTSIEAGWHVCPCLYNKSETPRLFVYWTGDGYSRTGCFNLACSGFVQKSQKLPLGIALNPVSSYNDPTHQFAITINVHKDPEHGDWWLIVENEAVGYWPKEIFTHLGDGPVNLVKLGGEVMNSRRRSEPHTGTQMGSGHFANEGEGKAARIRYINIYKDINGQVLVKKKDLQWKSWAQNDKCYSVSDDVMNAKNMGDYFFFGGPGGNDPGCE